jgi:hypothetical protein
MTLAQASALLLRLKIGPKEAAVLAVVADMKGEAQSRHVAEALRKHSKDPRSILRILAAKRLVTKVTNPTGHPFWKLTKLAELKLAEACTSPQS